MRGRGSREGNGPGAAAGSVAEAVAAAGSGSAGEAVARPVRGARRGPPLLVARHVSKSFQGRLILADVSATLAPGTVTLFSAPSGCGKSTLLEILAGVQKPDGGAVERLAAASLMFQDNALVPSLDAAGNLAYILPRAMAASERRDRIGLWLARVGLEPRSYPRSMSSGMKRRLSLARAFIADRPLTLLDEPFAFLDDRWHAAVAAFIREKAEGGGAVALAGHGAARALKDACGDLLRELELGQSPVTLEDLWYPKGPWVGSKRNKGTSS